MIAIRSILVGLFALSVSLLAPLAAFAAPAEESARQFVQGLTDRVVDALQANFPKPERDKRFATILTDSFDVPGIARFSLAGYWSKATEPERQEYLRLFGDLIIQTYSARLGGIYRGERLEVGHTRSDGKDGVWVASQIVSPHPSQQPLPINWRVRVVDGSSQKIVDVVVTNVSMLLTQRDEFVGILQKNGGDMPAFLETLRVKVKQLQAN